MVMAVQMINPNSGLRLRMAILHQTYFGLSGPSWVQRIDMSLFSTIPTPTHYWSELHNDSTGAKELSFFKSTVSF